LTDADADTGYTRLPFVEHPAKRWEFEPLRWVGINVGLALATWADHYEGKNAKESRATALLERLFG
jgi:hypothetical protein